MRTVWPTGSAFRPYRRSTTVVPSRAILAPVSMSDCVNDTPDVTGQLRISKYSGVTPLTVVVQFCSSLTTELVERRWGAAWRTDGTSVWIALRSSQVRVGWEPNPPNTPRCEDEPGRTISRFVPIDENACSTRAFAPSPITTMAMKAATPMMIPSAVKNDRMVFRPRARKATRSTDLTLTAASRRRAGGSVGRRPAPQPRIETTWPPPRMLCTTVSTPREIDQIAWYKQPSNHVLPAPMEVAGGWGSSYRARPSAASGAHRTGSCSCLRLHALRRLCGSPSVNQ